MRNHEEKSWRIIDACVPRGTSEKLARACSYSPELVNRWKRPPDTGVLNPLDIVELIQGHAFAHAPREELWSRNLMTYFAPDFMPYCQGSAYRRAA